MLYFQLLCSFSDSGHFGCHLSLLPQPSLIDRYYLCLFLNELLFKSIQFLLKEGILGCEYFVGGFEISNQTVEITAFFINGGKRSTLELRSEPLVMTGFNACQSLPETLKLIIFMFCTMLFRPFILGIDAGLLGEGIY